MWFYCFVGQIGEFWCYEIQQVFNLMAWWSTNYHQINTCNFKKNYLTMFSYILLFNEANSIFLTVKFGCCLILPYRGLLFKEIYHVVKKWWRISSPLKYLPTQSLPKDINLKKINLSCKRAVLKLQCKGSIGCVEYHNWQN